MKKLKLSFINADGKKTTITPKYVAEDLEAAVVQEAMNKMVGLHLFSKKNVGLYQKISGAKYVETIETPLFEVED